MLNFVVIVLATYRLAVILTHDDISQPVREWAKKRRAWLLLDLLTCRWCMSVWCGWLMALAVLGGGVAGLVFGTGLAASGCIVAWDELRSLATPVADDYDLVAG